MEIVADRWLGEMLGCPVFQVRGVENFPLEIGFGKETSTPDRAMYYAKIPTHNVERVRQLSAIGFYVVDVNVTFAIEPQQQKQSARSETAIVEIRPDDRDAVLEIAASCFQSSRFHLDPLIDNTIADRIKGEWVANYIRKQRGEALFVALVEERPAGFLAVLRSQLDGKLVYTIDLIGVSAAFRRRGIGRSLVEFFLDRYGDRGHRLQVGTQIANRASMRLYPRSGFTFYSSAYVLHKHVENGQTLVV